jgi:hypothetical protein
MNPMAQAWLAAGRDLGIRVEHPFSFLTGDGTEVATVGVYLPDFGAKSGTLLTCRFDPPEIEDATPVRDYFRSYFDDGFEPYDRELFIEALDDWGWFGSGPPPDWFHGGIQCHGGPGQLPA